MDIMTSSKLPPGFLLPFLGQAPLLRHVRPQTIRNLANRRKYHAQATLPQSHTFSSQPSSSGTDTQHGGSQFTAPKASRLKEDFPFPTKKNPSPYEVMHLAHTASAAEIKKRYYRLAFLYHPDSSNHSSASEHFAILNKAYKLLSHESSRSLYNRTGIGWTPGSDSSSPSSPSTGGFGWNDEAMRREARFRNEHQRQSTASSPGQTGWGGADRGGYQYTSARWGHGPQFYDASGLGEQPLGTGTPKYMSNQRFLGTVFVLSLLVGFVQFNRAVSATDVARDLHDRKHNNASQSLAEAKREAAIFGQERREQIRRVVRGMEVEREYERLSMEANAKAADREHRGVELGPSDSQEHL